MTCVPPVNSKSIYTILIYQKYNKCYLDIIYDKFKYIYFSFFLKQTIKRKWFIFCQSEGKCIIGSRVIKVSEKIYTSILILIHM